MSAVIERSACDGVLTLTLQRPEKRNAMNAQLVAELLEVLRDAEADTGVRSIVLAGSGGGFCAGSDLGELALAEPSGRSDFERDSGLLSQRLSEYPKPVVAAVHGFAIGGGLTLATSCDVVVTEATARWSLPEVPIGLFPAWGLGSVLARIGVAQARRLSFGIDTWDGAAAVRLGLADELVPTGALPAAHEIAMKLAQLPSSQAAAVKRFFFDSAFATADRRANESFMQVTESSEAQALFEGFRRKAAART